MRVGADGWRTNSGNADAAIMPVGVVAGLVLVELFVGIHCPLANDSGRSTGLLRQIPPAAGVNSANGCLPPQILGNVFTGGNTVSARAAMRWSMNMYGVSNIPDTKDF